MPNFFYILFTVAIFRHIFRVNSLNTLKKFVNIHKNTIYLEKYERFVN